MLNETMNGVMQANYMNDGWYGAGHHGWGLMHGPFSLLLIIAFILLLFWLFRRVVHGKGYCGHGSNNALATLSERFAKGEIDEEEFRAKRDVLKSRK